jgi:hypothetical protein
MEYQGVPAATMLTKVSADTEGAAIVRSAALALPQAKLAEPQKTTWQLMYGALGSLWNEVKPIVVPLAETALMSLLV